MGAKILLIEDDESLGATLEENLVLDGYTVVREMRGDRALQSFEAGHFDLVVLDVMLPGMTGLDILESLRARSRCPVLMISAKGTSRDRISGLEREADDYLPKPFHLREFQLRVQSLLRRGDRTIDRVKIGKADFDLVAREVRVQGEGVEMLTEKETRLIRLFCFRAGQVVSRQEILDLVWGVDQNPTSRTVDNFIVKLRKWIEIDASAPQFLVSHRGVGYALRWSQRDQEGK